MERWAGANLDVASAPLPPVGIDLRLQSHEMGLQARFSEGLH
jgi:hypothetical protein